MRFSWPGKQKARALAHTPPQGVLVDDNGQPVALGRGNELPAGHLFIEGDNLDALKLLQPALRGRVRVIYIDPPYNTGQGFVYADRKTDAEWLSMMYPRLLLARRLLHDEGAIFISIDDHEVHHLRMIMDEIFGRECFRNCIIVRRGIKSVQAQFESVTALASGHEYVLMYAATPGARFPNLRVPREERRPGTWNNHWRGTDRPTMRYPLFGIVPERGQWRWSRERSLAAIANYERMLKELGVTAEEVTQEQIDAWYLQERARGRRVDLLRLSAAGKPEHYVPPADTRLASTLWTDLTDKGSSELARLLGPGVFSNPKPVALIRRMLEWVTRPHAGDIVLDFFAGSCTTAHAVLELNAADGGDRRFIMVQWGEPTPAGSPARAAGYETIAAIGRARIARVQEQLGTAAPCRAYWVRPR
ncbi:MAG TPA: site-specific DNA-methyltransferase [Limnochordales bacterium]